MVLPVSVEREGNTLIIYNTEMRGGGRRKEMRDHACTVVFSAREREIPPLRFIGGGIELNVDFHIMIGAFPYFSWSVLF